MKYFAQLLRMLAVCAIVAGVNQTHAEIAAPDHPLPRDPNNVCGSFDNGLQYIVRKDATPPGKVSLDLYVRTGSLNESDKQRGLAHFTEHMAFKGSAHFAPSKLIPLLQHMGMTFGADTNAHTSYQETVYKLTMADNKPETIDTALTIFSDYASALSFYPIQIESERRVILEEARSRKNVQARLDVLTKNALFPGTQYVSHLPIGDEELIKTFVQSDFLDYWNTWYRPENMTLMAVGDIEPAELIAQAKEQLGTFKARAPAREPMMPGLKPFTTPRAIVATDPELKTAQISMICMKPYRGVMTTVNQYRRRYVEGLALSIVNRRLGEHLRTGDAPYYQASVAANTVLDDGFEITADATGEPKNWDKMLAALIGEISHAIDHGFTAEELDREKQGLLSAYSRAVIAEPTIDSRSVATRLSTAVGLHDPLFSAQQQSDLATQFFKDMTVEELNHAFKDLFDTRNYAYVVEMPSGKDAAAVPGETQVMSVASAAWLNKSDQPPEHPPAITSILAADPKPGTVASRTVDEKLGVTTVVFDNGVVLHHKLIDTKKGFVSISITLPGGVIEETAETKGFSSFATNLLIRKATHRFTSSQIKDYMVGKQVSLNGRIGQDSMTLGVGGSVTDLPAGMQLAYALLSDAVMEPSMVDLYKKLTLGHAAGAPNQVEEQLSAAEVETFGGNDLRLRRDTADDINRLTADAAEKWFHRIADNAAIEVAVVGDMQVDPAIDLVGRYLGSLPKRRDKFDALDSLRNINRPPGPYIKTVHFNSATPKAMVMAGYQICDETSSDRHQLYVASLILSERMLKKIRMEDNLVYSISCNCQPGHAFHGMGTLSAAAPTDPKNADKLAETILQMMQSFAETGPTQDELDTVKKQIATKLDADRNDSRFWLNQLATPFYYKRNLADLHDFFTLFDTYTITDIRDAVRKYIVSQNQVRIEAIPSP